VRFWLVKRKQKVLEKQKVPSYFFKKVRIQFGLKEFNDGKPKNNKLILSDIKIKQ
jgi:hypothetical protein